jgi:two-component system CheB/CheR fusion protein
VRDTGAGITREFLPKIFDAFEQGDMGTARQFGGLGLGLAICKAIMDMHGGAIHAQSDGPGTGATFTVELPAVSATDEALAVQSPDHYHATGQLRILLVEDHPDTREVLARLLRASSYAVKTAASVEAALQLAAMEAFDIVVSDLGLPDGTGYDLMKQIRDRHGIKGIALSGYGMEEDLRRSREAGFLDHIVKPVNVSQLVAVLQRVVGSQISG